MECARKVCAECKHFLFPKEIQKKKIFFCLKAGEWRINSGKQSDSGSKLIFSGKAKSFKIQNE